MLQTFKPNGDELKRLVFSNFMQEAIQNGNLVV